MGRRMEDLACSAPFVDWLADTLLPWVEQEYRGRGGRGAHGAVAGQSAGGLTAAFAAFQRPDRFGLALSQSGSFWWPDDDREGEWLTGQYAWAERRPVTLHLEVGRQEWMLLEENRRFRNILRARGYDVRYREFNGGHDYACWRGGLTGAAWRGCSAARNPSPPSARNAERGGAASPSGCRPAPPRTRSGPEGLALSALHGRCLVRRQAFTRRRCVLVVEGRWLRGLAR
ncbi:hypothetical protein SCYAM73S_05222 [Streptomyces cyaneofuscatus]